MLFMNFTVEETNLIAIYKADTLAATLAGIDEAIPDIYDEDIITIAETASRKLSALTDSEFAALSFELDEDADEGGEYAEVIKTGAD
jgi:hypothetical protein